MRKIEGTHVIYKYLDELPQMIAEGKAPLLIDCLNCEMGCNGGVATNCRRRPQDEIEWLVEQRNKKARAAYAQSVEPQDGPAKPAKKSRTPAAKAPSGQERLHAYIDQHWKPGLYERTYENLSGNLALKTPSEAAIAEIFRDQLHKETKADEMNCGGCGYGACRKMAVALYNGLSLAKHCTLVKEKKLRDDQLELSRVCEEQTQQTEHLSAKIDHLLNVVTTASQGDLTTEVRVEGQEAIDRLAAGVKAMIEELAGVIQQVTQSTIEFQTASESIAESSQSLAGAAQVQTAGVENVSGALEELNHSVKGVRENAEKAERNAKQTSDLAQQGGAAVQKSVEAMQRIHESSNQIGQIIQVISEIASQTNMLALNAAIEAARAGQHGLGFAVVADEVRKLAERSNQAARQITSLVKESTQRVEEGAKLSEEAGEALSMILEGVKSTAVENRTDRGGKRAAGRQRGRRGPVGRRHHQGHGRDGRASEGMAASSQDLSDQAAQLRNVVTRFRTRQEQEVPSTASRAASRSQPPRRPVPTGRS